MRVWLFALGFWLIAVLSGSSPARAETRTGDWAGDWVWSVEDKPAMILRLDASGHGEMTRPSHLTLDANAGYWRMIDASPAVDSMTLVAEDPAQDLDGDVMALSALDVGSGKRTRYRLTRTGADDAELTLTDVPAAPAFPLHRATTPTAVATDWVAGRAYGRAPVVPDNADLARLFADDQAVRQDAAALGPDVALTDTKRRAAVRRLLDEGQVRSGADLYNAAFIFQHGDRPDDYLLAHAMAVAAVARGRDDAVWIAAATLDRYLQSIGRSQVYGTQFQIPTGGGATQGAYDHALLPDAVRTISGVPPLAAQAEQLRAYDLAD